MIGDISANLVDQVLTARDSKQKLNIVGGNSKAFLGRKPEGEPLNISLHRGIVDYSPTELVMTARAGTPLVDLVAALDQHQQMLAFEPPLFDGRATIGGTLAANICGPARPWRGSIRDAVLGVRLINGLGQHMRFGGVVMKNVAGYDLSRFQAGALGSLGVITEVSFKVVPKPAYEQTICFELDQPRALNQLAEWQRQPKPLSAACWHDNRLCLRLSGAEKAVRGTMQQWGGEAVEAEEAETLWASLREMSHPFFAGDSPLWRFSLKSSAVVMDESSILIEWGGALRWVRGEALMSDMEQKAERGHGQVSLFRHGNREGEVHHRLPAPLQKLHQQIKNAVDPDGLFNPGRLYSWL